MTRAQVAEGDTAQKGPQIGAPPSLEQVPVARLSVDPAYQRATTGPASQRIIAGMVKRWDWALCQPLVVSRRATGDLFILDGQHRHAGAVARGDIPFLPCVLLSSLDHAGEASTFIGLNTARQALTQSSIFRAQLAAGHPQAKAVAELLDRTGWRDRSDAPTKDFRAGDLNCAPMLVKKLHELGEAPVRFALQVLLEAWPETGVRSISTFLQAMMAVHRWIDPADHARVGALLAKMSPDDWLLRAGRIRSGERHLTNRQALAKAVQRALAEGIGALEPIRRDPLPGVRPLAPAAVQWKAPTYGPTGHAWCSQCERRQTSAAAAACQSKFCKLKAPNPPGQKGFA